MSVITMIKEIKNIHPTAIALVKIGNFYRAYGKDAYIMCKLFKYKIAEENKVYVCGFPSKAIKKVQATLENKKINYLIIDRKDNYAVNGSMDFKNLNMYEKQIINSKRYFKWIYI